VANQPQCVYPTTHQPLMTHFVTSPMFHTSGICHAERRLAIY
jgi:hypothetical protein